jgi:DNA-binding NtrC family response regulator
LAVEDEPQVLRLIVRCLQTEGFDVLAAHSRDEAEQAAETVGSIDILVTDIFLGDGWGGELAFRLQKQHPRLAVVFVSGKSGEDPILRHGIQEHMVFLEKPFTLVELSEAVDKAMAVVPDPPVE